MRNSKIVELLLSLGKKERSELLDFVKMERKVSKQDLQLLDFVLQYINELVRAPFDKLAMEKAVLADFFAGQPETSARTKWNHAKNRLLIAVNNYIIHLQLSNHLMIKNHMLWEYCQQHQLHKNLGSLAKKIEKDYARSKKDFHQEYFNFKLKEGLLSQVQGQRKQMDELEEMEGALDDFFVENKLRILTEQFNRHRIINAPAPDDSFIKMILTYEIGLKKIGSQLFFEIYLMMTAPTQEQHYQNAKALFDAHEHTFSDDYRKTICMYLMNQCVFYCHAGQYTYAGEYLHHIDYLINNRLFLVNDRLSTAKYVNTVYMAVVSDRLEWLEHFVKRYAHLINHQDMESIRQLNLATIAFHKGDHTQALQLLKYVKLNDLYFKIATYKLEIKLYFEEGLFEILDSRLAAFRKYIERSDKIPSDRKHKNTAFLKAVKLLINDALDPLSLQENDFLILDYFWLKKKA
ncbi:MAG: hypothetical protein AAGG75_16810 [Bacteroidota bacterium]